MLGLRRSLLLVGYLFTTVHVLVLLSRYARPEARPELASYPGSIEASPEPEDHVPSDLHSITDSPISLRFLHNLENNTITFNCTSIFVSLSWKEIDRSSFVLLNWTEKASFATFRMVSSKLRFIYTPNISSCLEYSGSRCKTSSSDNDETLLIIVMNITMDFVIEHSCTVRQQPQASSDKIQMDYISQSWLITTPHPVCTVYYLFDHAAVTTATFGTFTTVATFATIVSLMPHKHKKTVLTNNNSLCCDHSLETLAQHTDRISETLAQHTDRISETLAQHTDRISETLTQHTDRILETVPQHTDNRHIDKKELNKETVKTVISCDAATMTEDSGDRDSKPSPHVDNLSNSSGTPAPLSDVPTHKELLIELEEVTEWQRLGLLLDLPYPKLKKIEKQNKELEINKMELFDLWLRYAKPPSWETIVCAVRKFNPNLAEKIALRTSHFSKGKNSDIEQQLSGESLNQTYHFSSASFPRFQQSSQTFMPPKSVSRPPFLLPTPRVSIVLVIIM